MTFWVVRFEHPNGEGWQRELGAHIAWLRDRVADGGVRASGPLKDAPDRAAMLVMHADDRAALDAIIATDPFAIHGLIENMKVTQWDPIFGSWSAESTMPRLGGG